MSNKVLIPAFLAHVGDWEYYICIMKYAQVARTINFAHELRGNQDINTVIQRGLSDRTEQIKKYLLTSEHRFLGALIVAAYGGHPNYIPVSMEDPDGMLAGLDSQFGVLTFDGSEQYFALDGQHRLKAIKDAVKESPELGADEIAVIVVSHQNSEEGQKRTRRLFTNINRHAKTTTASENILLEEDDGAAILSRRLISEHPLLSIEGFVKIFTQLNSDDGKMKLAGTNIPITEPKAFTTIGVLYDLVKYLSFELPVSIRAQSARPTDEELESSYSIISERFTKLLNVYPSIARDLRAGPVARELRSPKEAPGLGIPFMRPVIQKSLAKVINQICDQKVLSYDTLLQSLAELKSNIQDPPWNAVFNQTTGKMISNTDNTNLLNKLLYIHLAPPSKEEIKRVRKLYREIKGENYPISEEDLFKKVKPHDVVDNQTSDFSDKLSIDKSE